MRPTRIVRRAVRPWYWMSSCFTSLRFSSGRLSSTSAANQSRSSFGTRSTIRQPCTLGDSDIRAPAMASGTILRTTDSGSSTHFAPGSRRRKR